MSIFCEEPPKSHEALEVIPLGVVEVVSRGFEEKDRIGAEFYLSQGVKDVIIVDPETSKVSHLTQSGRKDFQSPVKLELSFGCTLEA